MAARGEMIANSRRDHPTGIRVLQGDHIDSELPELS